MISKFFGTSTHKLTKISYKINSNNVAELTLNNPYKKNSFSGDTIKEIITAIDDISSHNVRALILNSTGSIFCAGADLNWFKGTTQLPLKQAYEANLPLGIMLKKYHELPFPTLCMIQGDSYGGGLGLISASTISIAVRNSYYCFSEAKLGLIPSLISPYVVDKIGENNARRYFITAEKFDSEEAKRIGLINEIVEDKTELKLKENEFIKQILTTVPNTYKDVNNLLNTIRNEKRENLPNKCAELLSEQLQKENAKEGINAFLSKRKPKFV